MTPARRVRVACSLLLSFFASGSLLRAQVVAPEIRVEAQVIGISRSDLNRIHAGGFGKQLVENIAESLTTDPGARMVHRLGLSTTPGKPAHLHLNSRVPSGESGYVDIAISLDVIPEILPNRQILLTMTPHLQMQRGEGTALTTLFETQSGSQSAKVSTGKSVLFGGILPDSQAAQVPTLPLAQDNPVLRYLFSTKLEPKKKGEDEYQIVVLLTPHIVGDIDDGYSSIKTPLSKSSPGLYTVQVGAFRNPMNAERLVADLQKRFEEVFVEKMAAGSTFHRVRIGRLPDRRTARQLLERLSAQGFEPFIALLGNLGSEGN